ncbi:hypothetical protein [Flavobacterium sp. CLA17]|uniref:hypothetical protein n=1 Tax=Flavobacterium sp. CLA17 TaxID=2724135 RepID=UPI001491153D|nr:hypothetical protein [Flavobacterium sp. CLA17]QSB25577.1 hypothetical protein HAV12_014475 [Flavobacterium sp. CLA17]
MEHSQDKTNRSKMQSVSDSLNKKTVQNKAIVLEDNRHASLLQRKANNTGLPDPQADVMGAKMLSRQKTIQPKATLNFRQVVQRVLNAQNVVAKGHQFLAAHEEERQLIIKANKLLQDFSEHDSPATFHAVSSKLTSIRDACYAQTNIQANLVQEYVDIADEAVRKKFLDTVLQKDSAVLKPLFNRLINQTPLGDGVDAKYKKIFLSYVLQGMKFTAGEGRFTELMQLLGDRNIEINQLLIGPSAGLQNPERDNPLGEKTERRDKVADAELLAHHHNNLSEFIKAKATGAYARTANPRRAEIGHATVNMERSQTLLPIYYGHTATKDIQAFTSPMFAANHHELGHVVNKLKGMAGVSADKYRGEPTLNQLTDEEEVHNISIDEHSDKALTDQMKLPERIAHGAMGGLDAASPALDRKAMADDLTNWDTLTYHLTPDRKKNLELIKRIADANWSEHTKYGSKPSGIKKIMAKVTSINNKGLGMKKQFEEVRKIAITAAAEKSSNRSVHTSDFYTILSQMNVDSSDGLTALEGKLNTLIANGNL